MSLTLEPLTGIAQAAQEIMSNDAYAGLRNDLLRYDWTSHDLSQEQWQALEAIYRTEPVQAVARTAGEIGTKSLGVAVATNGGLILGGFGAVGGVWPLGGGAPSGVWMAGASIGLQIGSGIHLCLVQSYLDTAEIEGWMKFATINLQVGAGLGGIGCWPFSYIGTPMPGVYLVMAGLGVQLTLAAGIGGWGHHS